MFKLRNVHTEKEAYGWYYGRELARADLSTNLTVEDILKTRELKNGKTIIHVKFKGHDPSFNRWIEKEEQQ